MKEKWSADYVVILGKYKFYGCMYYCHLWGGNKFERDLLPEDIQDLKTELVDPEELGNVVVGMLIMDAGDKLEVAKLPGR